MIDNKIQKLRELTDNWLIIEYYTHEGCDMYKILNEYTHYNEKKLVLCAVSDGIEKALDYAIQEITKKKASFLIM